MSNDKIEDTRSVEQVLRMYVRKHLLGVDNSKETIKQVRAHLLLASCDEYPTSYQGAYYMYKSHSIAVINLDTGSAIIW